MNDLVGKTIKRYKIVKELGRGGMAVVYQATDSLLDRRVAVKLILSESSSREKAERLLKRFNREARALASLSHPNIVKILDYGEYEGAPFLVMEFIASGALRARMGSPIHFAEAAALLLPVARALHHAHRKRIIHRDVKPENILINDSNQLMLSDFGILKLLDLEESQGLTGTGRIVGTYAYMSPEQIRGLAIDGRADMYSLGIVFFEMITGRKPYNAGTPIQLSVQHLYDPIPKAKQFVRDLPSEVTLLITRTLAKDPEERYSDMNAFADALERLSRATITSRSGEQRAGMAAREKRVTGKRPAYSSFFASIAILLAAVLGLAYLFRQSLPFADVGTQTNTPVTTPSILPTQMASPTQPPPKATNTSPPQQPATEPGPAVMPKAVIGIQNAQKLIQKKRIDKISIIDMDWIENGNWLIDSGSQKVSFIDAATGETRDAPLPGEIPLSMAVASSTGRVYLLFNDKIKVVDIETFTVTKTFTPIAGGARSLAVSSDGKLLALGISDNKTQIISASEGNVVRNLKSNFGGWVVGFSPDSKYIVSGTSQGALKWDVSTGLWRPIEGGQSEQIKSLAFSHDGKWLAGGGNGIIFIWNIENGQLFQRIEDQFGVVNGIDFSPDDSLLVSGTDDGIVRIWNVSSGSLVNALTGHTGQIVDVCFSPDGQNIASGAGNEANIRIWGLP